MSRFFGEFTSRYIGEVLTWREYVTNLDLSHWRWENCTPWEDRPTVELGDNLLAVPVYAKDIYEDPEVSIIELPNNLLAISWDNFRNDVTVIRNEDIDIPAGWLLVEQVTEREFRIAFGCSSPFDSLQEIKEFLKEEGVLQDTQKGG
jgi:hypothetical protein